MQPYRAAERQRLVLSLLASSFFFKLNYALKFNIGFYKYKESIRCQNQIGAITNTISYIFSLVIEFITNLVTLATFKGA